MRDSLPYPLMTGVATFNNLKELISYMEEEIRIYKELVDDFGDKLGKLLRTSDGRPIRMASGNPSKSARDAVGWTRFGELLVYRGESSKAESEMYFQSTELLRSRLSRLELIKGTIGKLGDLESASTVAYVVFLREGIPERIVLRQKEEIEKFVFQNDFLVQ